MTVLLPVYNAGTHLTEAITSIVNQDHSDFEFIIIDDCSTDGSREVIREFAERDARIRDIQHRTNLGLANTLNEGLELAKHGLVARMDQDDVALPERLRVQLAFMENHPNVLVAGSWVYHMGAERAFDRLVQLPVEDRAIRETLRRENCIYHPSVILRRDVVLSLGGYRAEFHNAEDYDLWLRVARIGQLANIPRPLLRYRFSVSGMTLARKWDQMYYVCLAQVTNHVVQEVVDPAAVAREEHSLIDRRGFLRTVADGTIDELIALRMWPDALAVVRTFAKEIGAQRSLRLALRTRIRRSELRLKSAIRWTRVALKT